MDMLDRLSRWKYLRLLSGVYLAMFLIRLAFGIVIITFGHYVPRTIANDFMYGLLVASAPAVELVTVIFAGITVDRYGRKGVLLAGLALGAFSLYLLALARPDQFLILGLSQAIHGAAAGFILVTTLAIITAYAPADKRGREMGLFNFVNLFGWFGGFALGSALLDIVSDLRYTFVLAGFLATVGLVYGHLNIQEPKARGEVERVDFRQLGQVFRNPRVQVLSAAWLIVFIFVGSLVTFFSRVAVPVDPEAAVESAVRGRQVALGVLGVGFIFVTSQIVYGKLSDRYGREPLLMLGAGGLLGFMLTFLVATETGLDLRSALLTPVLFLFALGALAFAPAGLAALADEAKRNTEGTTMSAYSIVLNVGMITGPPLSGAVSTLAGERGVTWFFFFMSLVLAAFIAMRVLQVRADDAAARRVPVSAGEPGARSR